ncbi:IS200/IS605 family element transposase accessory protein TnpB [Nostoc sp. FACHB-87]|uniref:RNA-guided endonuclease InsQ/TnpB family protein n=1 Tax=Nostocales TaxID=1161 RepID=UPI001685D52F|nr:MULTISPECIES: RNA-guided endonuclease TnpB family protein [Nostocales]MBD2297364.1 IS200/IS605 family element transposase accessory protein TnpB [Nostoc sp. FACHB-190]MBD2452793.1 IS200/IS605 family element transposase accessory protein TnpB [Nostoc sp. FACHB-87]MBD2473724.1 IS200/IS605 family element transposase accessory protein TnpB [Anabaena sp. FACHB-83]MBD2486391.1 IS200/IS605 family element transposase accessory protein TnpB [Aulosira sp. FACHB-615]
MKRTVSIPVDLPSERFLPLMNQCAEIFNAHIDYALANSTYNKNKAHKELYHLLRVQFPSVPSALLQTVRDSALEAIKATKFKSIPKKKPTSGLRYDKRTMTLRGKQLTLSCIGKRVALILDVPKYFQEVFETWDFCGATVTYTKNTKQFWVRLVFEIEDPQHIEGQIQGIDRGLYHQAVTSDGQFFSSSKIRKVQRRYLYNRRQLQQKGTRSAKRRLKAMSGREKRFMRDTNHCVSKKLANQPGIAVFVLEDLSSIRTQRRGKKMNKWLGSWTFYQQEQFLTYKAEALGKRVVHQDPRYTSQKCNICKHIRRTNRHKSKFHCKNCGHRTHADLNAAKNVRDDYILSSTQGTEEQASVNMPDVSTDSFGQLQAPSPCGWGV